MKITKREYNLKPGAVIARNADIIEIVSEYDAFHGGYLAREVLAGDNDEETYGNESWVTLVDLIGGEIV